MNIKLTKDIFAVGLVVGFESLAATDAFSKKRNSSEKDKDSKMTVTALAMFGDCTGCLLA